MIQLAQALSSLPGWHSTLYDPVTAASDSGPGLNISWPGHNVSAWSDLASTPNAAEMLREGGHELAMHAVHQLNDIVRVLLTGGMDPSRGCAILFAMTITRAPHLRWQLEGTCGSQHVGTEVGQGGGVALSCHRVDPDVFRHPLKVQQCHPFDLCPVITTRLSSPCQHPPRDIKHPFSLPPTHVAPVCYCCSAGPSLDNAALSKRWPLCLDLAPYCGKSGDLLAAIAASLLQANGTAQVNRVSSLVKAGFWIVRVWDQGCGH